MPKLEITLTLDLDSGAGTSVAIGVDHDVDAEIISNISHAMQQISPLVRALVENQQARFDVSLEHLETARLHLGKLMSAEMTCYGLVSEATTKLESATEHLGS